MDKRKDDGYNFEALKKELLSRKYSYKTVKAYIYFNRDFLRFTSKNHDEITDSDIKNYPLYLAEKKICYFNTKSGN